MAKGKSSRKSASSRDGESPSATAVAADGAVPGVDPGDRYVGQWRRLVSTTNWEKGRIICQWRESLEAAGEGAASFSDEAWAQIVGGVTSQHVGRLRRTCQRFGGSYEQFDGLFWSHFHAALDWDDAEMWLEGAIQNDWSVSQMRGKRWETLGQTGAAPEANDAALADGDAEEAADERTDREVAEASDAARASTGAGAPRTGGADDRGDGQGSEAVDGAVDVNDEAPARAERAAAAPRTAVDVDDLPADLADAFEQFKLAIIAQRRSGWSATTPAAVIECLDALRELALAAE